MLIDQLSTYIALDSKDRDGVNKFIEIAFKWIAIANPTTIREYATQFASNFVHQSEIRSWSDQQSRTWLLGFFQHKIGQIKVTDGCVAFLDEGMEKTNSHSLALALSELSISDALNVLQNAFAQWICQVYTSNPDSIEKLGDEISFRKNDWTLSAASDLLTYITYNTLDAIQDHPGVDFEYWRQENSTL